ncbi:hypothetical protein PG994_002386 [Apiospora phragmitis]|uniref:Uncharacterized protein n=1 Tax=Apiospora phragmitis TaxID=2905665 RepID=A0ABR1WW68_9PEZI
MAQYLIPSSIQLDFIKAIRGLYEDACVDFAAEFPTKLGSDNLAISADTFKQDATNKMEEDKRDCTVAMTKAPEVISGASSSMESRIRTRLSAVESAEVLSSAKTLLMRGRVHEGLFLVERLVGYLEETFGVWHHLPLEARVVWCLLLTEIGQLGQAKFKCIDMIELKSEHLDRDHPLILEATSALVGLHRSNSCPTEAFFSTSENLISRSRNSLGAGSQQTLRYEFQKAALNLWVGNYVDGLKQLQDAASESKKRWGDDHPWTLSCVIEHSIALSRSGRIGECKGRLEGVLRIESRLFELDMDDCESDNFIDNLIKYLISAGRHKNDSREVHPSLLYALGAWAKNELTRCGAQPDQVIKAQTAILQIRKLSRSFGPSHLATLQAGLRLGQHPYGLILTQSGPKQLNLITAR